MTQQCVNCPGAEDHSTAQCPVMAEASAVVNQQVTAADSLPVGVPDGYMPIPTAEQIADALDGVRCFHDLGAELIAPELLANLLAATTVKAEQVQCEVCHGQGEVYSGHDQHFHYFDFQPPEPIMEVCPECGGEEAPSLPAAGSAELPEPDFALDGGSQPCYYAETVQRIVAALSAQQYKPSTVTRDQIRDVFMRNGFTVKEGQTDLKPYVYAAAQELLALVDTRQSATFAVEPKPLDVIGYASPGQIEIMRELPRTGGMKVKGRKDDRYSEPVVLLSEARAAMLSLVVRCQQEGAFKTCLECGYQDGHDEICQFNASNRNQQQSAHVSVPRELAQRIVSWREGDAGDSGRAELLALLNGGEA